MALTVVVVREPESDQFDYSSASVKPVVIVCDGAYPLGGYPLTPSVFGFTRKVFGLLLSGGASARVGPYQVSQDPHSNRLRFFVASQAVTGSGNAQKATDLTAWSEVASTTDLSAIRLRGIAVGY